MQAHTNLVSQGTNEGDVDSGETSLNFGSLRMRNIKLNFYFIKMEAPTVLVRHQKNTVEFGSNLHMTKNTNSFSQSG